MPVGFEHIASPMEPAPITPWPTGLTGVDPSAGVLVVGGTFDPPHRAHVELPRLVREALVPGGAILFVPAAQSPFKQGFPVTAAEHRAAMVTLAIQGVPDAGVWTDEIDRARFGPEPSYTIDTVRRLTTIRPLAPIRLLVGADQAAAFHRWKDARALLSLARPIVMLREPFSTWELLAAELRQSSFWTAEEIDVWKASVAHVPLERVSATDIRDEIRTRGLSNVGPQLSPAVREYISRHGLYGCGSGPAPLAGHA